VDLKEEDILGDKIHEHWYYVSKGKAVRKFLGDIRSEEVLDVGAGSGIFSRQLLDNNICQSAVCVDPNYEQETQEIHNSRPIVFVRSAERTTQKLTLMMDVLEHVEDDVALLMEYADAMPNDGKILITVPAFQFMWSGHDVFLEHYRRYTIKTMEKTITEAGLMPIKSRYFFGSLFPVIAAVRLMKYKEIHESRSELKLYPAWLNKVLVAIHDLERISVFGFNKAFGLSVFCLCEKDRGKS